MIATHLTPSQQARLVYMQTALKSAELYSQYWMAMATTKATCRRVVSTMSRKLTPDELIDEALSTALTHIHSMERITSNIALLLEGREDEIAAS